MHSRAYGWQSAGQSFAPTFMRHMHDFGTTAEQVAHVRVAHSHHASNNPKAYYKKHVTAEDVVNSRMICKPLHLLDCCVETDNANAIIVATAERAKDLKHPLVRIRGVVGRCSKPRVDMHYQVGPISTVAGHYAKDILWPSSGVSPEDVDLTGSYDAFTFTTMLQLEDYGFCKKGEGGHYVSDGTIMLGGKRPNNTSGGHLCEGYTHGIAMVIENVRQLRHNADDSCPIGPDGRRQPYLVLLVELDAQSGMPTKEEGLRVIGNLVRPDGLLAPKAEVERVGIGTRVRMVFTDVAPGLALPQWTIDETAASGTPWRYRG